MKRALSFSLVGAMTLVATSSQAAIGYDSRSMAMGGTGVASASYLTAAFYNPAQLTNYDDSDDVGLLFPSVGLSASDQNDLLNKLDTFQDIDKEYTPGHKDEWDAALKALDNSTVAVNLNVGMAIAIPNQYLSTALFVQNQTNVFAQTHIDSRDFGAGFTPVANQMNSTVRGLAGGTLDIGLAMGKAFDVKDHHFSVGITPKMQTLYMINYGGTPADFEIDDFDYDKNGNDKSTFNLDLGASYQATDSITIALAGRNLIKQSIENNLDGDATYVVEPKFTLGASYDISWLQLNLDVDLNETKYFEQIDYSTQYVRLGAELNAWDWAQLRAGYAASLTDAGSMLTAGIGLHPFGAFGIDLAGQYSTDNGYGASAQLIFTF
ncbi:hypothetical protein VST7929_02611 [Vibrio stylophorae]|uniref:Conjugal transfer protein TraF n=1 Tax=Vibrio stylophorae TaxID=659351 RepID=A0ABN8DUF1_9VIBR|nr:conjugal transfer protein TraF [Vibrio stylophorae]CAH0534661.1 hypothetical protein VST7929_02611 [Vibrio stylophorae]